MTTMRRDEWFTPSPSVVELNSYPSGAIRVKMPLSPHASERQARIENAILGGCFGLLALAAIGGVVWGICKTIVWVGSR